MGAKAPATPALSKTQCDARCPATALVMVERPGPAAALAEKAFQTLTDWQRRIADDTRPTLTFCGHHYHANEVMLAAYGWHVVADLRAWKSGVTS